MDGLAGFDPPKMLKTRSRPDSESFEKSSTGRAWMGSPTGITWRGNWIRMSFDIYLILNQFYLYRLDILKTGGKRTLKEIRIRYNGPSD